MEDAQQRWLQFLLAGDYCNYNLIEQYHGRQAADRNLQRTYPNASRAIGAMQSIEGTAEALVAAPFVLSGAIGGTALEYAGLRSGHASSDLLGAMIGGGVDLASGIAEHGAIDYASQQLDARVRAAEDAGARGDLVDQGRMIADTGTMAVLTATGAGLTLRGGAMAVESAVARAGSRQGARTLAPSERDPDVDHCPLGQCFVAGTPVLTISGLKPIETLEVGELIASRNEITGDTRYRRLERVIVTHDREVIDLDFRDASTGAIERITATPNHPFHTPAGGWTEAGSLELGQAISSLDGRTLTLSARSEHLGAGNHLQPHGGRGPHVFCGGLGVVGA